MHPILGPTLTTVHAAVCALLALLGTYRIVLLVAFLRSRRRRAAAPAPPAAPARWPRVTVQLPIYNERFVARRLLEAVSRLDYPRDRLQIQVLDDSTDRTATLLRRLCARLRRRGLDIACVHRPARTGFKAGALADGLQSATGDLVAIFDADFVPAPDFLRAVVPHVLRPGIGVVQARWGHLNRTASWFTRLQAVLLDGHFCIEQPARCASGWLLTFNGTAGVWRRAAIEAAGGWTSDTLTEDLDLSFRAQLAGWRILYLDDVVVPAELPADSDSLRSQQRRWTKGGVQVARKLLPRILGAQLPWHVKVEAALHLGSYAAYPLLVLLVLLRAPARYFAMRTDWLGLLPGEPLLLAAGTLPLALFYLLAERRAAAPGGARRWLADVLPAMALGAGLALGNAVAVLEGLRGGRLFFERTPKRGWAAAPKPVHAYRSPATRLAVLELLLVAYLVTCKLCFTGRSRLGEIPFLSFFAFGLLAMCLPSLRETWVRASPAASRPLRLVDPGGAP